MNWHTLAEIGARMRYAQSVYSANRSTENFLKKTALELEYDRTYNCLERGSVQPDIFTAETESEK